MESSLGFMAVFAVSGSVVFLASQFHKRLLSDYMDKFDFEIRKNNKIYISLSAFFFFNFSDSFILICCFIMCDRIAEKCGDEEEGEICGGCGGAFWE